MKSYNNMYKNNKGSVESDIVKETSSEVKEVEEVKPEVKEKVEEVKPEVKPIDKKAIVVKCSSLNVRKLPDVTADVEIVINEGTEVKIYEKNGEFTRVKTADGIFGYCMTQYLEER